MRALDYASTLLQRANETATGEALVNSHGTVTDEERSSALDYASKLLARANETATGEGLVKAAGTEAGSGDSSAPHLPHFEWNQENSDRVFTYASSLLTRANEEATGRSLAANQTMSKEEIDHMIDHATHIIARANETMTGQALIRAQQQKKE